MVFLFRTMVSYCIYSKTRYILGKGCNTSSSVTDEGCEGVVPLFHLIRYDGQLRSHATQVHHTSLPNLAPKFHQIRVQSVSDPPRQLGRFHWL